MTSTRYWIVSPTGLKPLYRWRWALWHLPKRADQPHGSSHSSLGQGPAVAARRIACQSRVPSLRHHTSTRVLTSQLQNSGKTPQRSSICTQESKPCQATGLSESIHWLTACGLIQGLRSCTSTHGQREDLGEGAEHSVKKPGQQEGDEDKRTATSARVAQSNTKRKGLGYPCTQCLRSHITLAWQRRKSPRDMPLRRQGHKC